MTEESLLIQQSRAGDREAFAELVRRYQDRIFNLTRQVCAASPDQADGVYQETFINAFRKLDRFQGRSGLGTWLYRIASNLCWMRLRRQKRAPTVALPDADRLEDPAGDPARQADRAELQRRVADALGALPVDFRMAVMLSDIQGLSDDAAARALEISVPAFKSRLFRGRRLLREKFTDSA